MKPGTGTRQLLEVSTQPLRACPIPANLRSMELRHVENAMLVPRMKCRVWRGVGAYGSAFHADPVAVRLPIEDYRARPGYEFVSSGC